MNTTVSFPGLGIDEFVMSKVAFSLFGKLEVRWYGVIITLGIALSFLYVIWRGKKDEHVISDDVIDVGLWTVTLGVIGARLYYVLTDSGNSYQSIMDVIAIWNGGLAIYGAIIGGVLGIFIGCKRKKIYFPKFLDMTAPAVMFAQALGRWGNFVNGEAHGYPIGETTKFYFFNKEHIISSGEGTLFNTFRMGLGGSVYYHPTFLYESVWNLIGFVLINLFYRKKKYHGQVTVLYFAWYGFGRMFIEGLRTDSLYLHGTTIRISQLLGLLFFVVGLGLLIYFAVTKKQDAGLFEASPIAAPVGEEAVNTAENTENIVGNTENITENTEKNENCEEKTEDENHGTTD